jgi:LPS O-antigen subunit length determinant protein (WzzB/FepE family)
MDALRFDINNQGVKRKELLDKMQNVDLLINDKKEKQTKELVLQKQNLEKLLALAKVQLSQLSPVEIIQRPFSSIKPVAPRKVLIVALAGVGGLFLGIFVAFLMAFVQKVKEEEA